MNPGDIEHFMRLLKDRSGIDLGPDKAYMLDNRLGVVAGTAGFSTVGELLAAIRRSPTETMVSAAIDAMTTNETFFFRDDAPFEQFRSLVIPRLAARQPPRPISVWCAGCSTGQEPYSLAMLADEHAGDVPGLNINILASDISDRCLTKARTGLYSQFEIQRGLSIQRLTRHFEPHEGSWRIKAPLRQAVGWRKVNLTEDFSHLGRFDVVFCRNVLIYFDRPTRSRILDTIAAMLSPGGYLFLGASETTLGLTEALIGVPGQYGMYQRSAASAVNAA